MENTRYNRNRLYITEEEQRIIKDFPILLGGCGIGSVIAECALRFGFEKITIIDGDQVELSNLNRQNYIDADLQKSKVSSIYNRLQSINSEASIKVIDTYITEENVEELILGNKLAINALDFTSEIPLLFDQVCQKNNIPILHPYNLGWGGLVTVISPEGMSMNSLKKSNQDFNEVNMVEYATTYLRFWGKPQEWIEEIIDKYKNEKQQLPPPQLSVASWIVAGMCTHLMFNIATGKEVKIFPEFYLTSLNN